MVTNFCNIAVESCYKSQKKVSAFFFLEIGGGRSGDAGDASPLHGEDKI